MTNITSLVDRLLSMYEKPAVCPGTHLDYAVRHLDIKSQAYEDSGYDLDNLPDDYIYMNEFTASEMTALINHFADYQPTDVI